MHDRYIQRTNIPRWMNRLKGNYTQGRAKLVTSPAIKDGVYDQETIEISTNERSVILRLGSPDEDHRRAKF